MNYSPSSLQKWIQIRFQEGIKKTPVQCLNNTVLEWDLLNEVRTILEKSFDTTFDDEDLIANKDYLHFYCVEDGKVVSYLTYDIDKFTIYNVCTSPDKRRTGYASALLRYALNVIKSDIVYLYVDDWNTGAKSLYENLGFRFVMIVNYTEQNEVKFLMRYNRNVLQKMWQLLFHLDK